MFLAEPSTFQSQLRSCRHQMPHPIALAGLSWQLQTFNHLSDKKLARNNSYLHWDCANTWGDPDLWLRYYATAEERRIWADENEVELPPRERPPYRPELPQAPL